MKVERHDVPNLESKDSLATGGGARSAWFKDTELFADGVAQMHRHVRAESQVTRT